MCQCGLLAVLRSHIGILMCLLDPEPCRTFIQLSVSVMNDLAHRVFDGVGPVGFKSRANTF